MLPTLDHIVLLVPHDVLRDLPSWLTSAFTVTPGGQHTGGITENQLILFQDGVYIEIIAFVHNSSSGGEEKGQRRAHRWGRQPEGHIIDWAVGLAAAADPEDAEMEYGRIQKQVKASGAGLAFENLVAGGRTTPDGVVLKWATASPADRSGNPNKDVIGSLPFWCLDRTERKLRVPYVARPELARHPLAVVGVAGVTLYVADPTLLERLRSVYNVLFGDGNTKDGWVLSVPEPRGNLQLPRLRLAYDTAGQKIQLSLYTTGSAQTVGGSFVGDWRVDIQLIPVKQ
ncbi:hypothetical protein SEPCBS57363_003249 [Sporothrix epigloea]|uniref:Glyoxalase-like domain-containing protein n=1 Tax=Sporothrix epigloea TaxID=1892477 RepID=A0ABP0DKN1_9PEZI